MWPNSQETADLVTFMEEILMENFIFCAVLHQEPENSREMNNVPGMESFVSCFSRFKSKKP